MRDLRDTCRIAVVQAASVMFDKAKSVEKALELTKEAADNGAELVVFPELFIPGYPVGMNFGFSMGKRTPEGRLDYKLYYDNSMLVDGPEVGQFKSLCMERASTFPLAIPSVTR